MKKKLNYTITRTLKRLNKILTYYHLPRSIINLPRQFKYEKTILTYVTITLIVSASYVTVS